MRNIEYIESVYSAAKNILHVQLLLLKYYKTPEDKHLRTALNIIYHVVHHFHIGVAHKFFSFLLITQNNIPCWFRSNNAVYIVLKFYVTHSTILKNNY